MTDHHEGLAKYYATILYEKLFYKHKTVRVQLATF